MHHLLKQKQLTNVIQNMAYPLLISGLTDSAKSHIISSIIAEKKRPALIVTHSELRAKQIKEDISFFLGEKVHLYPSKDIIFFNADVRSTTITVDRFSILNSLISGDSPTIVLSIEALMDKLTPKQIFTNSIIKLNIGDNVLMDELKQNLVYMGYERTDPVEQEGQFAIRGGIVDIFTPTFPHAFRLEFFGDEIDSIRTIDTTTQRSLEKINKITIFPMRELVYSDDALASAIVKIKNEYTKTLNSFTDTGAEEEATRIKENIGENISILESNKSLPDIDKFFSYFYSGECLLSYFPEGAPIFFDEPNKINNHAEATLKEFEESTKNRILNGNILPTQGKILFSYQELCNHFDNYSSVLLTSLPQSTIGFSPKSIETIRTRDISIIKNSLDNLVAEITNNNLNGTSVIIFAGTKSKGERLLGELKDRGVSVYFKDKLPINIILNDNENHSYLQNDKAEPVNIITMGSLNKGFEYLDYKLAFISDKEVFIKSNRRPRAKKSLKIESFADLKIGDYIVHDTHGIGIYNGLKTILSDNVSRDYLQVSYADSDTVYVSVNQVDRIQKYIGGENVAVKRMGGAAWEKAKLKVKEAVKELAVDLAKLYAKRNNTAGFQFAKDTVWQKDFEESFPFQETDDQILAIEDVKKDMESQKVMDRLICGDVGFGKTEIALRAAFKAVQDNKQVAFLVPTTILAQQHYITFLERMRDYPINIEVLSRFRTRKAQQETIERLKNGGVDIVIGTHRLLSKDVVFKNLGLVVVDEEQRFGVTHKEKLKQLTINVDVLTLTATPIPRTLHMSLSGIRDISLLQEAPTSRKNIQTFVLEYDAEFVKTAIVRELSRGGQVYYLHNKVRNISSTAKRLKDIIPTAKIEFAHGQMSEIQLENVMMDFIQGSIDVLVCTTIIETGLDIPNVNTIIIQDSDRMGLAQLYQLRGRVGRSDKIAYSYLMYKKDKILDSTAESRLQTIRDFTEFGSGFKVALKDLEIRGVGSLLGAEQHGQMGTVGYEMYTRLLEEAIKELDGESEHHTTAETTIDIRISAYIAPSFIGNEEQRLYIYKKISHIKNENEYYQIQEELEDRYGDLPIAVNNLLNIALLRATAATIGVVSINQKHSNLVVEFSPTSSVNPENVTQAVVRHPNLLLTVGATPYITYKGDKEIYDKDIVQLRKILEELR